MYLIMYYVLCPFVHYMLVHVYYAMSCPMFVFMFMFMQFYEHIPCSFTHALYSLSWHHLASILSQLDPSECGFSEYIGLTVARLCYQS